MTDKTLTGIVTWLKNWFYDKTEMDTSLNGKAPTSHSSDNTTYGVGTTSKYGHVKTINSLTQSSHSNGTALSAYQGKILKGLIDNKANSSHTHTKSDITDFPNIPYENYYNYSEEMSLTRTSSNVTKVVDNGLSFKNLDKWKMSFELKSDSFGARLDVKNINNLGDFKNYIGFGLDSGGYLKAWWATGNGTESGVTFGQPMSLDTYYPMVIERKGDYIRFNWNNNVFYTLLPQYFNTIEDLSLQLTKFNVNGTMYAKNIFIEVIEGIK